MKPLSVLLCLLVCPLAITGARDPENNSLHQNVHSVIEYLEANVLGRWLETSTTVKIDGGKLETDFSRRAVLTNMQRTERGFRFDEVIEIKQTTFTLNKDGQRELPGKKRDRSLVIRHFFVGLKSTERIRGYSSIQTNSASDPTGSANAEEIHLAADELTLQSSTVGYTDHYSSEADFSPGASATTYTFKLVDDKLERINETRAYSVDPDTLQRTLKNQEVERIVDREIE